MSTTLDHLLPGATDEVRCADHARSLAVDPGGTAIRADRVVAIATPGTWPKPALAHPLLIDPVAAFGGSGVATRVLAAHPEVDGEGSVIVFDRLGPTAVERVFAVAPDRPAELARLAQLLAAETETGDGQVSSEFLVARHEPARPTLLLCAQGTHDVCCGAEGTRLALAMAADPSRFGGVRVLRVSHTGGHRFAPTGMTLPDGRMWSGLSLDDVERLFTPGGELGSLVDRCRGWWGADKGHAQVAERAVLGVVGRELGSVDRSVTVDDAAADSTVRRCVVTAGERSWVVEVAVAREIPTIACRKPGGQPVKPGREYETVSITER
ncbi:MAG: sucrase ferredoxin [Acidimicrobiales bacterium]